MKKRPGLAHFLKKNELLEDETDIAKSLFP